MFLNERLKPSILTDLVLGANIMSSVFSCFNLSKFALVQSSFAFFTFWLQQFIWIPLSIWSQNNVFGANGGVIVNSISNTIVLNIHQILYRWCLLMHAQREHSDHFWNCRCLFSYSSLITQFSVAWVVLRHIILYSQMKLSVTVGEYFKKRCTTSS